MSRVNNTIYEQEVAKFIGMSLQSVRQNDAVAMETIFSEDYDLVVPTGDVMNKRQLIEIYRSGDMKQETLEVENLQVRVYGDMAIARGLYRSGFKYKGQQMEQTFLRTDVLAKSLGNWQIVTSQTTQSA
jgi:ketosteroid isomerase-like protein